MRLRARVVASLVLAGCASGSSGVPPSTTPTTQTVSVPPGGPLGDEHGLVTLTRSDGPAVDSVAAPPARTLAALRTAYADAGIAVTLDDPATGRVGNPRFVAHRALGGTVLSSYLRCGSTMTGERATSDRIHIAVASTVRPLAGGGSSVATQLVATAVDVSGSSSDRQLCTSTGVLESRLNERARKLAAAP